MKTVQFGRYKQNADGGVEPINWNVLNETEDNLLLMSRYSLDTVR